MCVLNATVLVLIMLCVLMLLIGKMPILGHHCIIHWSPGDFCLHRQTDRPTPPLDFFFHFSFFKVAKLYFFENSLLLFSIFQTFFNKLSYIPGT
jgi:hypothetical protein